MSHGKYQYSIKLLEEQLSKNQRELEFWNSKLSSNDPLVVRQANGNIGGCTTRIEDLTTGLAILNPPFSLSASSTPKGEKTERPVTQHVVDAAMKQVSAEVRAPKVVRDGIVKPENKVKLDFKAIGKKYGQHIRAIQAHLNEHEAEMKSNMEKDGKYEFTVGETPIVLVASDIL